MSDSETTFERAEVTLGRVQRYYQLLVDLGLADAIDEAQATAVPEPSDGPASFKEQAEIGEAVDTDGLEVTVDIARVFREIAARGALVRLGTILFEVSEEEAKELPAEEVESALFFWAARSDGLIKTLLTSVAGTL